MSSSRAAAGSDRPGFWASLWNSATSFQFYPRIQDQPFGRSLRYLLVLAVGLSLLISLRVHYDFSKSLSEWASWLSGTIPDIRIENGIASLPSGKSKTITDDRAVLILDPTGETKQIGEQYRTGMILSKDKLILKWNQAGGPPGQVSRLEAVIYAAAYTAYTLQPQYFHGNSFDLAAVRRLVIDPENIRRWKDMAARWFAVSLPFVYFVFYLAGKLLQALFFSVVLAYSQRAGQESPLGYGRALNLCIYALTPPALFAALVSVAGIQVPYLEWVFLGMYVAFLMGALSACAPKKPQPEKEEENSPDNWIDF